MDKFKSIVTIILKNKLRAVIFLVLSPISSIFSILFTLSLEPIIQSSLTLDGTKLIRATLIAVLLSLLDMFWGLMRYRAQESLIQGCADTLRRNLMNGILSRPVSKFGEYDISGYISIFDNNINRIKDSCFLSICHLYESGWSLVLSLATLIWFSPWMGIFLLMIGLISICFPSLFTSKLHKVQAQQLRAAEKHLSILRDILHGYWIIRNHGVEKQFREKYHDGSKTLSQADLQGTYYPYMISWMSGSLTTLAYIGIISISTYMVIQGQLTASIVLSLSQLIGGVLVPLETIPHCVSKLKGAGRIIEEIKTFLDNAPNKQNSQAPTIVKWDVMDFKQIDFTYEKSVRPILENASLRLERGKKYVIIGKSGAGKSTLAKILSGLCPASFSLTVDEVSVDSSVLSSYVSYMDQNVFLFNDTVYQNVSLYRQINEKDVSELLDRMELDRQSKSGEDILSVFVGESGAQLSGGERQRIALARDLIRKKDIFILDECTSGLDHVTAEAIDKILLSLEETTCIFITHRLDSILLKQCDAVFLLEEGKLIRYNTTAMNDNQRD